MILAGLVGLARAQPCTDDCESATWLHIPGPNPLLSASSSKNQPDLEMAGGLVTDPNDGKHYMFYHETHGDAGFTMDAAVSDELMGPFVPLVSTSFLSPSRESHISSCRSPANLQPGGGAPGSPHGSVLSPGKKGEWDSNIVASFSPGWDSSANKWLGYYIGCSGEGSYEIGLATADKLAGPWSKSKSNPGNNSAHRCTSSATIAHRTHHHIIHCIYAIVLSALSDPVQGVHPAR